MYPWDYIKQRNAFYAMAANNLTALEERLYNRLFDANNHQNRLEWFIMSNTQLALVANMDKPNMIRVRNSLAQKGLIEVKQGRKKGEPTKYKLRLLYDTQNNTQNNFGYYTATQFNTQFNTQNNTQNNTQFNTQNFSESNSTDPNGGKQNEDFSEPKNDVLPTNDYLKVKEKGKEKEKESNARAKKTAEPKISYAEAVTMTEAEYATLLGKLKTNGAVEWCIEKLNNYKLSNGKTYKSDFRAILNWVIGEYETQQAKKQKSINGITTPFSNPQYEMGQRAIAMIDAMEDGEFG